MSNISFPRTKGNYSSSTLPECGSKEVSSSSKNSEQTYEETPDPSISYAYECCSKIPQLRATVGRNRKKEQKQQHINVTENILLKGYTTTGVRNFNQKSSGRPHSGDAWNSCTFWNIPGMPRILSAALDIQVMWSSNEETGVLYTKKNQLTC
ncbi:hypothetical protein TNCV_5117291 [Trichonephila clavipes]|nr:hypothetical protein TNCV_5117291 [Trichonephila clavipes]